MKQPLLFFGFPADDQYIAALANVDARIYQLFVGHSADTAYLQLMTYRGQVYLGKELGNLVECATLELMQANIYSLLRKLIPSYPYEEVQLRLLSLIPSDMGDQS